MGLEADGDFPNTGEYLGFSGKRRLLEAGGVDVLNVHASIGMSRAAAHLAGDFGIPVSLGNTIMEIGVHLAASLPEVLYLEFSDLMWNTLAKEPVKLARSGGHSAQIRFSRLTISPGEAAMLVSQEPTHLQPAHFPPRG